MKRLDDLIAEISRATKGTEDILPAIQNPSLRDYASSVVDTHNEWLSELRGIRYDLRRSERPECGQ